MEAKKYFFKLSYEQYLKKQEEEHEKWETEVLQEILNRNKEYCNNSTPSLEALLKTADQIELFHSNSFKIEKLITEILRKEKNQNVTQILDHCWVANWDLPAAKNACVILESFYDGSYLVRINTEYIINVSRIVWLYTTILLLVDITPYADFRDRVSLNNLKNKFIEDIKNDTDGGTTHLFECYLTHDTKKALNQFVSVFYESALVFIIMHEIGHILELDDSICKEFGMNSSKDYGLLHRDERQRYAEKNADKIGCKYSDAYVDDISFFNMGPVLAIFALAANHKSIIQATDHPSLKSRYENMVEMLFRGKERADILHTRKLLYIMGKELQDKECWSTQDKDWWKY